MKKSELIGGFAAAALFAAGAVIAARVYMGYQKGIQTYQDMEDVFTDDPNEESDESESESENENVTASAEDGLPEDAPELISVDWDNLSTQYEDCVAWIQIPSVDISYPVVQGADNDQYLHNAPDGSFLFAGSIFMDYRNEASFLDQNTLIYGHNMRNGTMFGKLKQLNESEVLSSCPYFWIYTPDGDYLYRIFSVHVVDTYGDAFTVQFTDDAAFEEWVQEMNDTSDIETAASADADDLVVTLSTCNGNKATRQVVQGYRVWAGSSIEIEGDERS